MQLAGFSSSLNTDQHRSPEILINIEALMRLNITHLDTSHILIHHTS
jgi:hypothetical protein